jgi:hypothetical protein
MAKKEPAFLEFEGAPLYFDAVISERTRHAATVTEHNVEDGANVADHIRSENDTVSLELFISNSPVNDVNGLYSGQIAGVELKVPKLEKTIPLSPGGLLNAGIDALTSLFEKEAPWKAAVLTFPSAFDNVSYVLGQLLDWKERGVLGKVITPHRTYENMAITLAEQTRTRETGDGASLSVELKGIRLVEAKMITAPIPTEARGKVAIAKGRQPTSFVRDPKPKMSLAKVLKNKAGL